MEDGRGDSTAGGCADEAARERPQSLRARLDSGASPRGLGQAPSHPASSLALRTYALADWDGWAGARSRGRGRGAAEHRLARLACYLLRRTLRCRLPNQQARTRSHVREVEGDGVLEGANVDLVGE